MRRPHHERGWGHDGSLLRPAARYGILSVIMAESMPDLRTRQRELTHDLIMDAFSELTLRKPGFTMQELAEEAGISVRTLYRYYPSREALHAGLLAVVTEKVLDTPDDAAHPDAESIVSTRRSFSVFGEHDKLMRAVVVSRLAGALADPGHEARTDWVRAIVARELADKPEVVQRQVTGIIRLLASSVSWMALTDQSIGLTSDEAGAAVAWAVRLLADAARAAEEDVLQ